MKGGAELRASLVAQTTGNPPAMWEASSLGREEPLEKGTAACSSILAWRIPWREEPRRLQSMGSTRVGHDLATKPTNQPTMEIEKTTLA